MCVLHSSPPVAPLLFTAMGLLLSSWLCGSAPDCTPLSPSAFLPLAAPTSSRLALTLNSSPVLPADGRSRWSSVHRSPHFLLSSCQQEATRSPAELSSDGARAEVGVKSGLHVWELTWSPEHRGSHAVVGVSKQDCPLQDSGYKVLVGGDSESWGWELTTRQLWHGGQTLECYPGKKMRSCGSILKPSRSGKEAETPLVIPERVLLVLDADAGTLGFVVDGNFLGVAFKDLPRGVELFPAISSVRGEASIRLRYLNGATCEYYKTFGNMKKKTTLKHFVSLFLTGNPPALMALCGLSIRQHLDRRRRNQTDELPLPPFLRHYLFSCF